MFVLLFVSGFFVVVVFCCWKGPLGRKCAKFVKGNEPRVGLAKMQNKRWQRLKTSTFYVLVLTCSSFRAISCFWSSLDFSLNFSVRIFVADLIYLLSLLWVLFCVQFGCLTVMFPLPDEYLWSAVLASSVGFIFRQPAFGTSCRPQTDASADDVELTSWAYMPIQI